MSNFLYNGKVIMGIAPLAVELARERFPEAEVIRVDGIEIEGWYTSVKLSLKMPPTCPALIEIIVRQPGPTVEELQHMEDPDA